jgi:phage-related minor tail protein
VAKNIKGITIEIDGSTTGLDKALQGVNKQSRSLQSELRDVDKLLKFSPGNLELIEQKQKLLGDQVATTTDKLNKLKSAQQQVEQQFRSGKIGAEQYRAFKREITESESKLGHYRSQLSKVESQQKEASSSVRKLGKAFKEAGTKAKEFGSEVGKGLGGAGAAGAAAVGGLVAGMQEYNQDLARLKTNASAVGQDLGLVEDAFMKITEVTGETDSAVETVSNLLASGFNDNQLAGVIEQINGAAIKFSDTLKTEGIADGLQETFASGEAIGPFAELLERSGVDLDTFNTKLQEAQAKGEGANFITKTLAEQGFGDVYNKYQELNPEVQKSAEANAQLQKSLADLAIVLSPLVVKVTEIVTKFASWAAENPKLVTALTTIGGILATVVGVFMALAPVVSVLVNLWPILAAAFGAITAPVAGVIAGIAALIAIGVLLYKNWDEVKAYAIKIWEGIKTLLLATWEVIKAGAKNIWNSIKDFFSSIWNGIKSIFNSVIDSIVNFVKSSWNNLKTTTTDRFNAIKSTISNIWNGIKSFSNTVVNSIVSFVKGKWNNLKSNTSSIFNSVKSTITSIWNSIKSFFTSTLSNIISTVKSRFSSMVNTVRSKMNDVKSKVQDGINRVKSFLSGINLKQMGKDMIQGLINGIGSMAKNLVKKAKGVVNGAIEGAKNLLGIASPSRVFMEIGEYTGEGMAIGMDKAGAMVQRSSRKMADAAIPNLKTPSFGEPSLTGDLSKMTQNSPMVKVYIDGQELKEMTFDYVEEKQYLNTQSNLLARGIR